MSGAPYSAALLRSSIVARPCRNPDLASGYHDGTIATKPARSPFKGVGQSGPSLEPYGAKARQMRSYDRTKTWGRKRTLGGAGKLPNNIRCWFTEGERAVLTVIAEEVKKKGKCVLPVLTLARRAGVGVRTVQYTLALARGGQARKGRRKEPPSRPMLIHVKHRREEGRQRNDWSVITIVSREWLLWLDYRPSENPAGCTEVRPNSILTLQPLSQSENVMRKRRAIPLQWAHEDGRAPPAVALSLT